MCVFSDFMDHNRSIYLYWVHAYNFIDENRVFFNNVLDSIHLIISLNASMLAGCHHDNNITIASTTTSIHDNKP